METVINCVRIAIESEARFRRIADNTPAPIWVTCADHTYEFVNEAFADFFGVRRDKFRRINWKRYLHPDDAQQVMSIARFAQDARVPHTTLGRVR